jgi:hypothetical protein
MSRFIKLTKLIINTNAISHVATKEDAIYISLRSIDVDGFFTPVFGSIGSDQNIIKVSNTSPDYQKVIKWIESIE